jgi:symplekin
VTKFNLVLLLLDYLTFNVLKVCVNRIDLIPTFFVIGSRDKADVLAKAIKGNMQKLSQAVAAKHGASKVARQVADLTGLNETPLLLSFIENLVPIDKSLPDQDLIEACFKIQESKIVEGGKKDPRFIIPIVSAMKRHDLIKILPDFVSAGDNIFLAALARMRDRVGRQALLYRDEVDEENPTLLGMTLCEQLVFLHKLDFASAGLPQKRYLAVIKLCLDGEEYNDQVLMYALDYMSETFLAGTARLPLAFMLTCIRVCNTSKHESLHSWIGRILLPRLVESNIWNDARQWEGWMRCAHMLENNSDPNISSKEAIDKLPSEQLAQYRAKWTDS